MWDADPENLDQFNVESFATIQDAHDAIPQVDSADTGTGILFIPSRGARESDGAEPYKESLTIDRRGIVVHGTGIHTKIEDDTNNQVIRINQADIWLHSMWVNQTGGGHAVRIPYRESYITNFNIDGAGDCGIIYENTDPGPHNLGPEVEIKDGPTAAVQTQGRVEGRGIIIEEYFDNMTVGDGIISRRDDNWSEVQIYITNDVKGAGLNVQGPRVSISNSTIRNAVRKLDHDGPNRGIDVQGVQFKASNIDILGASSIGVDIRAKRAKLSNVEVRDSDLDGTGAHTPGVGFRVRTNDNVLDNVTAFNCSTASVEFYNNPVRNVVNGEFPDGIAESSTGDADRNVINGLGWDSAGSGSSPAVSDWDWRPGVKVWNRDDDTFWQLDGDASAFTQIG